MPTFGGGKTSLKSKRIESECNKLIDGLKKEQELLINQTGNNFKKYVHDFAQDNVCDAFNRLILLMYQYQTEELEKDLIKCIILNPTYVPTKQERLNLMRWLWQNITFVYKDYDYSKLLDRVREINESHKVLMEHDEDVPFV